MPISIKDIICDWIKINFTPKRFSYSLISDIIGEVISFIFLSKIVGLIFYSNTL